MPTLAIKSGTTAIAGSTVKGSFSYFSGSTKDLGPTSSTGFYSGVDAPVLGYTVYQIGGSGGWTARVATSSSELNSILISAGGTGSTVDQNITWATNTNSVFINSGATAVGQAAGGGVIAYILQSGDPGYNANVPHGFIAATSDQSTGTPWGCYGSATGAKNGSLGGGSANTSTILANCAQRPIAASVAAAYNGGGYTDWYLPSINELQKLYDNRAAIGGFTSNAYWTSTEDSAAYSNDTISAWYLNFSNNGLGTNFKFSNSYVRAIRSF